mgnify:CR=1 FL=1
MEKLVARTGVNNDASGDTCTLDWITVPGGGATVAASTSTDRLAERQKVNERSNKYFCVKF